MSWVHSRLVVSGKLKSERKVRAGPGELDNSDVVRREGVTISQLI
jgi:hypothetical protein